MARNQWGEKPNKWGSSSQAGGDSEIFDEYIDATDQQRNTALANVSNQTANSTTGKMGYKVLDPTKTFASQVTAENTIYEIRDVFDLGGTQETPVSFTLPANSTLKFNGGVIKNCTIVPNESKIVSDYPCLENVQIGGIINKFSLGWLKDTVIDDVIDSILRYCGELFIPIGTYTLNTTWTIELTYNVRHIYGEYSHYYNNDYESDKNKFPTLTFNCEGIRLKQRVLIEYLNFVGGSGSRGTYDEETHLISGGYDAIVAERWMSPIRYCTFKRFNCGIRLAGAALNGLIENCFFRNQLYAGISLESTSSSMYTNGCTIERCHFESIGKGNYTTADENTGLYYGHGIVVRRCSNLMIENCMFEYVTGVGVYAYSTGDAIIADVLRSLYIWKNYYECCKYTYIYIKCSDNPVYQRGLNINSNHFSKGSLYNMVNTLMDSNPICIDDRYFGSMKYLLRSRNIEISSKWYVDDVQSSNYKDVLPLFKDNSLSTEIRYVSDDVYRIVNKYQAYLEPGTYRIRMNVTCNQFTQVTTQVGVGVGVTMINGKVATGSAVTNSPVYFTYDSGDANNNTCFNVTTYSIVYIASMVIVNAHTNRTFTVNDVEFERVEELRSVDISNYKDITIPNGAFLQDSQSGKIVIHNGSSWLDSNGVPLDVLQSGNTSNRPTGDKIYVGFMYFDTEISPARPIYASAINGSTVTWVDATGTAV